ncbi:MAG: formate/nitrite transporter family protein [Oscillospiraceae bacterium]|jgi:formate/nitrite transporter|nr:formate/nitrite transporter family protein [Oscillospiraceae bacterium]
MNQTGIFSGAEVMAQYASALGAKKASGSVLNLFLMGIVGGVMIGFGAVAAGTASYAVTNPGLARLIAGLIFPFGLGMVMLMGSELFTGNTMIFISVLNKSASLAGMLKNWACVYFGNMAGNVLLAAAIVYSGQLNLGGGELAVYVIKTGAAKCAVEFFPAVVLGILCNVMVCLGVLCALTAKDTAGKILGAYIPVAFFVMGGFEHCVANMYYIPAAIFALGNPGYAALAANAGIATESLTAANMFITNLLPVTIGNIIGGAGIAVVLWFCHRAAAKKHIPVANG